MISWPERFCAELVRCGVQAVRFDNRDAGRSSHLPDAPDLQAALAGDFSSAAYTLSGMAGDTVGLLDVLGFDSAHMVGASLGGMIAQTIAIEYPGRVRSLTSMMSTTGDRGVGQADLRPPAALGAPPEDRAGFIDWQVRAADVMCDVSGGRATAAAIPGAELVIVDGMGHSLPQPLWPDLAARIAAVVHRTEALTSAP
jgi:pimeloyl-ACP methyl ester carboxylesterase